MNPAKIRKRWLTFQNKSISYVLSFLGIGGAVIFNGCMYGSPAVEYGTPVASFKVTGKVTDETGEIVSAIKVVMKDDSTRTSPTGEFEVEVDVLPQSQEYHVKFVDDDGAANGGEFTTLDTLVKFTDPKFEGGDGDWYSGTTSKVLNVKLTKKNG